MIVLLPFYFFGAFIISTTVLVLGYFVLDERCAS